MKVGYMSIVVVLLTLFVLLHDWYQNRRSTSDLSRLEQLLDPLKQKITRSAVIGFDTNIPGDDITAYELYFKTSFVLAPSIAVKAEGYDTLLSVSNLSYPAKVYDKYRSIDKGEFDGFAYSLMVLKK